MWLACLAIAVYHISVLQAVQKKINMPSLTKGQETWCSPIFSMNLKWLAVHTQCNLWQRNEFFNEKNLQWNELYKFRAEVLPYSIITIYLEDSDILSQCAQYIQPFTRHLLFLDEVESTFFRPKKDILSIYGNTLIYVFNLGFGDLFKCLFFTCET